MRPSSPSLGHCGSPVPFSGNRSRPWIWSDTAKRSRRSPSNVIRRMPGVRPRISRTVRTRRSGGRVAPTASPVQAICSASSLATNSIRLVRSYFRRLNAPGVVASMKTCSSVSAGRNRPTPPNGVITARTSSSTRSVRLCALSDSAMASRPMAALRNGMMACAFSSAIVILSIEAHPARALQRFCQEPPIDLRQRVLGLEILEGMRM